MAEITRSDVAIIGAGPVGLFAVFGQVFHMITLFATLSIVGGTLTLPGIAGVVLSLWAYASAVERSRRVEIGVANLYLLTGATAPPGVKRTMAVPCTPASASVSSIAELIWPTA